MQMKNYTQNVLECTEYLKTRIQNLPIIGFLTGTGLGESAKSLELSAEFEYKDIPHFPISTVQSHPGKLLFGQMSGKNIVIMQGRFHLYEGYSPAEVTFPIRVMRELGVKYLIISNASGGMNPMFNAGDIMIIRDHINLTGENPLLGANEERWGVRFPDMINAYDKNLIALAESAGKDAGILLQKGVYIGLKGPSLETPAEVRFLKLIGAEAVGFSTVMETIAAVHCQIKVLGLSTITNINDPDRPMPANIEEIISVAKQAASKLEIIVQKVAEKIND
jgi:purine-nucleoside phosphorylase